MEPFSRASHTIGHVSHVTWSRYFLIVVTCGYNNRSVISYKLYVLARSVSYRRTHPL